MMIDRKPWLASRALAIVAASVLVAPMVAGCGSGGSNSGANLPPVDDSRPQTMSNSGYGYGQAPQQNRGMSTKTKVAILAGAAALYYMYRKNKQRQEAGQLNGQPTYFLSKNGRVYYRDQSGQAHWVTPPPQGIQVPYDEAQQYRDYQGYNNQSTGRDLTGLGIE
ncbi:hypothetical protein [Fimbriimonas ginsengisoli]|uniref:WW domain-containing protein n=1 Tax=Fimbriimonas ginsengisoli Gsoil 348 TaxID=661478 RepID=A0A068NTV7_FIMGI|nr:hypothetical protein [Fimbriimonas ginsengisoli]AIE86195.1 hypothetical protein OP10G_2827 [Fimbriimonas ginsengisoli Gsoil 348]